MKALHGGRSQEFQLGYHLKRNDTPDFSQGQPGRIDLARMFIEKMLLKDLTHRPLRIIELGCGSGDVTGPYAGSDDGPNWHYNTPRGEISTKGIEVIGVDVVPQAVVSTGERWPNMTILLSPVEELQPMACDLLVMTEFLEHVADPVRIAREWMSEARWVLIGHPLDEPDPPYEHGHAWSYDIMDWTHWFTDNGFHIWERVLFPMGYYDNMILGHGSRG